MNHDHQRHPDFSHPAPSSRLLKGPKSHYRLYWSFLRLDRMAEAETQIRRVLSDYRREYGEMHPETLMAKANLARVLSDTTARAEQEAYRREVFEASRQVLGDDHAWTMLAILDMGNVHSARGDYETADKFYRERVEECRRLYPPKTWVTVQAISTLGTNLCRLGRFSEAEERLREAYEGWRWLVGGDHVASMSTLNGLGWALWEQGRYAEAEVCWVDLFERSRRVLGIDSPLAIQAMRNLGLLRLDQGRLIEAEQLCGDALQRRQALFPGQWVNAEFLRRHAETLVALARHDEAEAELLEAYDTLVAAWSESHPRTQATIGSIIALYDAWHGAEPQAGHDDAAASWRTRLESHAAPAPRRTSEDGSDGENNQRSDDKGARG